MPTSKQRTKFIYKNKHLFHHVGKDLMWQPRIFPSDPEFIHIGDNVRLSSNVSLITHDTIAGLLNKKYGTNEFFPYRGGIKIGNNVMIGARCIILPNVQIGSNVIIGAGAIVTKDIPSNSIVGGIPAKVIGKFDDFVNKRRAINKNFQYDVDSIWSEFDNQHNCHQ